MVARLLRGLQRLCEECAEQLLGVQRVCEFMEELLGAWRGCIHLNSPPPQVNLGLTKIPAQHSCKVIPPQLNSYLLHMSQHVKLFHSLIFPTCQ